MLCSRSGSIAILLSNLRKTAIPLIGLIILAAVQPTYAGRIDSLSLASVKLELYAKSALLGTATGFVIKYDTQYYLITNWHVVTGRDPWTDSPVFNESPDTLAAWLPIKKSGAFAWVREWIPLYDSGAGYLWVEHPLGREIDVVALPLRTIDSTKWVIPLDISLENTDVDVRIAMDVSIIGFPKGLTGGGAFPIWKTGQIASEPDIDFLNMPIVLVDTRTVSGMSGSPALLRMHGSYLQKSTGGYLVGKTGTRFMGVYSGRLPWELADKAAQSDLGIIWKAKVITEIIGNAIRNKH
jgi:hypothetical protein